MAPHYAVAALLSLAAVVNAQSSVFWTATERYVASPYVSTYTRNSGSSTSYTYTTRRTIKPNVTPTATPNSVTTSRRYLYDLEIVTQYYGVGANIPESDLLPAYDPYASTTTTTTIDSFIAFSMPITMTAPSFCPTPFTVTTTASVSVPSQVWPQITPTSTKDGGLTTSFGSIYSYQTWYLSEGAAPASSTDLFNYRYYVASCSTIPGSRSSTTSSPRSGGGDSSSGNSGSSGTYCYSYYSYYCSTSLKVWIIIIASIIPGLFLLGILESWFWFRRLMMGKSAMRCGTVCWVLLSLWILCFTRMQDARSTEDQKLLQEKWKNMGSGAAFKAWMKWGLRRAYPVEHLGQYSKLTVGIVPDGQPLHPAMAQAPPPGQFGAPGAPGGPGQPGQVFYYGPPPPGWVPTPDGQGYMPPQGYVYPTPQHGGYYANDQSKDGSTVSASIIPVPPQSYQAYSPPLQQPNAAPISPLGQTPPQPQPPQPYHPPQNAAQVPAPSPPPQGSGPPAPQSGAPPPANVSEAPSDSARPPQPPQQ